ncbi:MAG: folate-binding protein YgfZ [Acidobacteria bacterium]|nr:folate-binding protein YgfZ [Acidobacteriota bacterium]
MKTALQDDSKLSSVEGSGDVRAEFNALLSGCGLYDLSDRAKIALSGGDRTRWLNGMISNNVRDLAAGHGVYSFLLNAQGRIQADLYAFNRGESLLIDMERSQRDKVWELFDHYIIADDVEMTDVSEKIAAIGLTGPESRAVLERAGIPVPELSYLQFGDAQWQQAAVTVVRAGEEAKESWQVWVAPEHSSRLWDVLVKAGADPTSAAALNMFRISRGIPQFATDIRDRDLPQETGQTRALNFTKGCYLGQEIVERIRSRGAVHRQFTAFAVEGPLPEPSSKILADGKEVGEVTSSVVLPFPGGDFAAALGYLRREAAGKEITVGDSRLRVVPVPIVSAS